jgi:hypothetical protein
MCCLHVAVAALQKKEHSTENLLDNAMGEDEGHGKKQLPSSPFHLHLALWGSQTSGDVLAELLSFVPCCARL